MQIVRHLCIDGPLEGVVARLKLTLHLLIHCGNGTRFRIGTTSDPQRRADAYDADASSPYAVMELLYAGRTAEDVRQVESALIHAFSILLDNPPNGEDEPLPGPQYFLYLVTDAGAFET